MSSGTILSPDNVGTELCVYKKWPCRVPVGVAAEGPVRTKEYYIYRDC